MGGISPGMFRDQVIQHLGQPDRCWQSKRWCAWENADERVLSVQFKRDRVSYLFAQVGFSKFDDPSFTDASGMRSVLGEPDVYSVSDSGWRTRYTYLDSGLTVNVDDGQVAGYGLGHVAWRATATISEYWVAGRQICPSAQCPFEFPSNRVRDAFVDQTVRDVIQQGLY